MHMGIGEEAICAGILDHLEDGDAMALDHRGTPPMIMRGIDPVSLHSREMEDRVLPGTYAIVEKAETLLR